MLMFVQLDIDGAPEVRNEARIKRLLKLTRNRRVRVFGLRFSVLFIAGVAVMVLVAFFSGEALPLVHYIRTAVEAAGEAGADTIGELEESK